MTFKQHDDVNVLIPQHISKIGCYTSNVLLFVSFHGFFDKYYILATMLFFLYITTFLHWRKVYKTSLIKTIDIVLCVSTLSRITLYDSYRWKQYRLLWLNNLYTSVTIFIVNETVFYFFVKNEKSPFYIHPYTKKREIAYYINTLCHTICLHVFLCLTASYSAIYCYY
jgi:hypothetical protein